MMCFFFQEIGVKSALSDAKVLKELIQLQGPNLTEIDISFNSLPSLTTFEPRIPVRNNMILMIMTLCITVFFIALHNRIFFLDMRCKPDVTEF